MKSPFLLFLLTTIALAGSSIAKGSDPNHQWSLDAPTAADLIVRGSARPAPGATGNSKSLALDGYSVIEVKNSASLTHGADGFTILAWINPYGPGPDQQQIIAAKNRYSRNEREWSVMIDKDGRIKLQVRQDGWQTVTREKKPAPGHWHLVGVTAGPQSVALWVNGQRIGEVQLEQPIPKTAAPLTFGGVNDGGRIWQTLFGALDEVRIFDHPLLAAEMEALFRPVELIHSIPKRPGTDGPKPDPALDKLIQQHSAEDRTTLIFDGKSPDQLACDTTLRPMPDGSWVVIMLGGGDTEPMPRNRVFLSRSLDQGKTWTSMEPLDFGVKSKNPNAALVPSELMVHKGRCTLFVATHDGTFSEWKEWMTHSDDSCRTWSPLEPAPGRLHDRTFIRNHIVTRDGRILLPFQHYLRVEEQRPISNGRSFSAPTDPRNGVLMSSDGGKSWTGHGDIRLSPDDNYHGWAENNIVELGDGRIAMVIRADRLGGVLHYAESTDGGRTWPEFARKTNIPNPGSKATLYPLGGNAVALLHNPNPAGRFPLALWVSFDGLKTWPYQRVLVAESSKGIGKALNYPDGFVSPDRRWLHFAFDDARYRAVYVGARLPEVP